MRVLVQRVKKAEVIAEGKVCGAIQHGLLAFLGIHADDQPGDTVWLVNKLVNLRIFSDEQDKMNLSVKGVHGEVLVVSQFTLYANCQNGRRPDFFAAAKESIAVPLYEKFVSEVKGALGSVQTGEFGAKMEVSLVYPNKFNIWFSATQKLP